MSRSSRNAAPKHRAPSHSLPTLAALPALRPLARAVTFAAFTAVGTVTLSDALAQPTAPLAQTASYNFDIPAGPLAPALRSLATTAGVPLTFTPEQTDAHRTTGLQGEFGIDEAFARLLSGTGLQAVLQPNGGYALRAMPVRSDAPTLPPVTVSAATASDGSAANAYRSADARAGVLGRRSLRDTPYSIEVYSQELMENLQARSLADMTKGDASIALASGNLITENNSLAIRGLPPDGTTGRKIDGMNTRVRASDLPLEHFERVEILKGASGFLYGVGAPGGVVNHVLKRPDDEAVRTLNVQAMDSGLALVHGDLGGRFGTEDAFGYRINLVHESGNTYSDDGKSRRDSASAALDWRITPDLVWRADALTAKHLRDGGYWALVPNADGTLNDWTPARPLAPIRGDKRLAPSFTRYGSRQETYGTDLAWQFTPDWQVRLAHRVSESGRQFLAPAIFTDADGNYTMRFWNYSNRFDSRQTEGVLAGTLRTGEIEHNLALGASHTRTTSRNSASTSAIDAGSGNLSDPVDFGNPWGFTVRFGAAKNEYQRVRLREFFVSDTLKFGDRLDLIAGLRRSTIDNAYTGYGRSATTPTLAVVYRPVPQVSTYASYVEALEQGATAPATAANAYEVFSPLKSKQYELGVKAEGRDWSASASLFRLERGLTYTDANNVFTQDGEARFQGLEVGAKASLGRQWVVTASAMWLDASNQKTIGGTLDGKRIQGVARQQLSAYGEYRVAQLPLTLSAGARYIGKRPVDAANRWHVSAVTLLDAGARYETEVAGKPVTVRLNIDNLANKAYWVTQPGSSNLIQGAPRTIKLGAQIAF